MDTTRTIGFERSQQSDSKERNHQEKVGHSLHWLLLLTTVLVVFGLTMLYSASYGQAGLAYFKKQLLWVGLGTVAAGAATVTGVAGAIKAIGSWF